MGISVATYALGAAAAGTAAFVAISIISNIVIGMVIGALTKSLAKKPSSQPLAGSLADRMSTVRSPVSAWRVIFGEVRVSGTLTFLHSFVDAPGGILKSSYRHMVLTMAGHEVKEIGDIYFNDELVDTTTTGTVVYGIGKWTGHAVFQKNLGSTSQTAFSELMARVPTLWTSNHRQRGRAGIYLTTSVDSNIYPGGLPNITALVKGYNQVYDPRTVTTGYSNNPALCVAAYLCNTTFGYGVTYATGINETALITAANICDERVDAVWQPTFTAVAATDVITFSANNNQISTGEGVKLTTTGVLPATLAVGTVYYLITTGAATGKLAATYLDALNGAAIDLTDAGTGTHTLERCAIFLANATEDWLVFNQSNKKIFTGDGVRLSTNGVLPAPLVDDHLLLPGTASNYASTPDSVANSITGDIDIRVKVAMDDWTPGVNASLFGKRIFSGAQDSYFFIIELTTGRLIFNYSTNGSNSTNRTSTAATGFTDGTTHWVRVTVDVNDGAGNHVVKFYTSEDGETWTQLGTTVTTAGTISIFDGTLGLGLGAFSNGGGNVFPGKIYRAQIYNGIAGTLAVDFNAEDGVTDATSMTSRRTGEVWTINQSGSPTADLVVPTYYAIRLDDDTIQLAAAYANALAGTVINITDEGTGIHTARLYDTVRYTCNGTFMTSEEPLEIIEKLCSSMAGHAVKVGKTWRIVAGAYVAPEGSAYLNLPGSAGNYASTPDSVANSITGDIDIRVKVAMDDWTPAVASDPLAKDGPSATERSYRLLINTGGTLALQWYPTGATASQIIATSTAATGVSDGAVKWIRATLDADNGAAGNDAKFYTSDDGETWAQLGTTVTTAGTTSLFNSTSVVTIGCNLAAATVVAGKIYRAQIYNGIAGTLAVDFNAEDADNDAISWTSVGTGEAWTVNQSGTSKAVLVNTVATLSLGELRGAIDIQPLTAWRETVNGVKGVFVSPENHWQPSDFPPILGTTYLTEDGNKRAWKDLELPFTTRTLMAQRIAKIELYRSRLPMRLTLPCRLSAYRFQPLDTFKVRWGRYGLNSQVFEVVNGKFVVHNDREGNPALGYDLIVQQTAEEVFDWTAAEGAELRLPPPTDFPTIERLRALVPRDVGGLEIFEQGGNDEFVGKHCKFAWRRQSLFAPEIGGEAFGAGAEVFDMLEPVYLVRILTTLNGSPVAPIVRREEPLQKDTTYVYTYEKNVEDGNGTPTREFLITVRQVTKYGQRSQFPAYLNVTNPVSVITDFTVTAIDRGFSFTYSCADTDFDHIAVYASLTSGFTPSASNLVYSGNKRQGSVGPLLGGRRYYYKIIPSDLFGAGATSAEASVVTLNTAAETAVSNWTTRTSASNSSWLSIAWSPSLRLFAAVASNDVMTSPDGINWTSRTPAAANIWQAVVWSPALSLFVAVSSSGVGNRVMTSSDGITWTSQVSAADYLWYGLAWSPSLSLFVAVGLNVGGGAVGNNVMTSPNGINWTLRSAWDLQWDCITWSAELSLFVAVEFATTGLVSVMTSSNGTAWTKYTGPAFYNGSSVTWSASLALFVAVGDSTTPVMTSSDGAVWALGSAPAVPWNSVVWVYKMGLFLAVGYAGTSTTGKIMSSSDGITWTLRSVSSNNYWYALEWSPELGVLVAVSITGTGTRAMTSQFYME